MTSLPPDLNSGIRPYTTVFFIATALIGLISIAIHAPVSHSSGLWMITIPLFYFDYFLPYFGDYDRNGKYRK